MDALLEFLSKHYILWIVISIFLVFALIGYFVRNKRGDEEFKIDNDTSNIDFSDIEVTNNVSINDALKNKSSIDNTEIL